MTKSVARAARREANAASRYAEQVGKTGKAFPGRPATQTSDSFQNVISRLGYGTDNQSSYSTYNALPITNLRQTLDLAYRSSWVCRAVVQGRAKDMTRAGIDFDSDIDPGDADILQKTLSNQVWPLFRKGIQWGRLYGGAGVFMMIDGQKPETPLQLDRIPPNAFKGLLPLDRWMLEPSLHDLVTDMGSRDFGLPKFYRLTGDTPLKIGTNIHHSRFIRFEGDDLPYYQRLATMLWGMSVLEPVWDRLISFDSTTAGTAQLVYRASIRNLYIEKWKETVAAGGARLNAQLQAIDWVRRMQGIEGITVMDSTDRFESLQFTFAGLDTVLIQMGQQISGATRYPLVILFGQSPAGFNATGEADIRMYYDSVFTDQNNDLKPGLDIVLRVAAASAGIKLPDDFAYSFNPLWQLSDEQKTTIAAQQTTLVLQAFEAGLINRGTALKELKQQSHETGVWTNITDEEIEAAEDEPLMGAQPPGGEEGLAGLFGGQGGAPGVPGGPGPGQEPVPGQQPDQFLPGQGSQQDDRFLPGQHTNGHTTPFRAAHPEEDSSGAFPVGETERVDTTVYPPLFHIHHPPGSKEGMLRIHLEDEDKKKPE